MLFRLASALLDLIAPAAPSQASSTPLWSIDSQISGTRFTWRQALTQGNTGVVATPSPEQQRNIEIQAHLLEGIWRCIGPFTITSWLRTPEHNRAVGGATHSSHLVGAATDLKPLHMTVEEAKKKIRAESAYPGGMEINTTTWVHADHIHTHDFIA